MKMMLWQLTGHEGDVREPNGLIRHRLHIAPPAVPPVGTTSPLPAVVRSEEEPTNKESDAKGPTDGKVITK